MTDQIDPELTGEQPEPPRDDQAEEEAPQRTGRDVLYEQIGVALVNAGIFTPAAEFVDQVRREAGFRVSPREVATTVGQVNASETPVTAETVADIVSASRGDRSRRQQRHADLWRALGAQLILHDMDGSPEGQREFIGQVRRSAGPRASDALLLQVAIAMADAGERLDADRAGKVAKRLATSAADLSPSDIAAIVPQELRAVNRQERARKRQRRPGVTGGPRNVPEHVRNPGARKMGPRGPRRRTGRGGPKPSRG